MSISSRCRFVVGTIDGKCVSYIVDQPIIQPTPSVDRRSTSNFTAKETTSSAGHHNRPSTTTNSTADSGINNADEDSNGAKINASVTLSNQQLDELMDILQRQQVGEQQNKQAWSTEETSGCPNEQYLRECQSAVHEKPTKDNDDYYDDSRDSGYYGASAMKPSLLDLKKQQWARERAEMEGFLSPWGRPQSEKKGTNHSDRIHIEISRPNTTKYNHTQRSPNATSRYIESNNQENHYESNYPTDSSNSHTPASRMSRSPANHNGRLMRFNGNQEEGRLKWGDRGIAVGHLWEPSDSPSRLPEPQHSNPAWLEKSLASGGDDIIYSRKVYIEPAEQEERDIKRRKALEHQQAIREQLEERERKRREERELRVKEEKEEEERIRKENAIIDARYKMEKKKLKKALEEDEESMQQHAQAKNKQSQGWNKREVSPRGKNRQRHHSETNGHVQMQTKSNVVPNQEAEILTLHHPEENYPQRDDFYNGKSVQFPGGEEEMILLGKEVAVLLAPELERRILMSRSGRDVSTQTEITQIYVKRSRPLQNQIIAREKPIWGANRTTKKYIKQSDKDIYRQRGVSVNSRTKQTTDSTDESDRYPRSSPQLDRRKRAQSLGKTNHNNLRANEEDNFSSYGGRPTRKDTWQAKQIPSPMTWIVDAEDPVKHENILHRRATNSPPVPAILNKKNVSHQQSDRFSPIPMHRVPCPPSPPVPAVLRQLQEQTLPPLVTSDGETSSYARSVSPVITHLPTEREEETTKLALPDIKKNLMAIPTESSDLLSQLTSIRKTLQNKQLEWQTEVDES